MQDVVFDGNVRSGANAPSVPQLCVVHLHETPQSDPLFCKGERMNR